MCLFGRTIYFPLGIYPGMAELNGGSIFSSLRNLQTDVHSGWTNLHPNHQCMSSSFSAALPASVIFRLLNKDHSDKCEMVCHCGFDLHFSNDQWY